MPDAARRDDADRAWVVRPADRVDGPGLTFPFLVRAMAGPTVVDVVPIEDVSATPDGWRLSGHGDLFMATAWWGRGPMSGHWEVALDVIARQDRPELSAGLVIVARLEPGGEPRWLIPGLFYRENRGATSRGRYPRFGRDDEASPSDPFVASSWSFRSDRAATPAVLGSGSGLRACLAIGQSSAIGGTGLGFGVDDAGVELRLLAPYREEPVVYDGSPEALPADLPVARWAPGQTVRLSFRAYVEDEGPDADRHILRDLDRWLRGGTPRPLPAMRVEATADIASEGLLRWHDRPEGSVIIETAAFDRDVDPANGQEGDRAAMHVAWLSGAPTAAALLLHGQRSGDVEAVAAGRRVLDAIASHRAPCGTFWGQWTKEGGWGKGWTPGPDALHGRTLAEAALFMTRATVVLPPDDPTATQHRGVWLEAVRSNLQFVVAAQSPDGSLPSAWNGRTGEVIARDGTSQLAWVPALTAYADLTGDGSFLDAASRAGTRYAGSVLDGSLCGAPEDVDLAPTSEDGYVAVMAYVALLEHATDPVARARWLQIACAAADWALTFRYAYDVALPPTSSLGRRGFRTRGLDQASPANQHLHTYGLVSLPEMVRLAAVADDPTYLERTREHLAAAQQCLIAVDGDLGGRRGMMPERYYQTRYGGPIGEVGRLSHAWCLGLLLYACEVAFDLPELLETSAA